MGNAYTVTDYSGSGMSLVRGESIDPQFMGVYLTEEAALMTTRFLTDSRYSKAVFYRCSVGKVERRKRQRKVLELIKSSAECRNPVNLFVPEEYGSKNFVLIDKEAVETAKKALSIVEKSSVGKDDDELISFEASKALSIFNLRRLKDDFPFCVQKSVDCYLFNDTDSVYCYVKD